MFTLTLLAVVPKTLAWNPSVALVMLVCNILAIAFARYTVQRPNDGPSAPALPCPSSAKPVWDS